MGALSALPGALSASPGVLSALPRCAAGLRPRCAAYGPGALPAAPVRQSGSPPPEPHRSRVRAESHQRGARGRVRAAAAALATQTTALPCCASGALRARFLARRRGWAGATLVLCPSLTQGRHSGAGYVVLRAPRLRLHLVRIARTALGRAAPLAHLFAPLCTAYAHPVPPRRALAGCAARTTAAPLARTHRQYPCATSPAPPNWATRNGEGP